MTSGWNKRIQVHGARLQAPGLRHGSTCLQASRPDTRGPRNRWPPGPGQEDASPLPVSPPTAKFCPPTTFVPVSSPTLPHAQDLPSAGSAGLLGHAPDWMERDGVWPAEMRELRCAGRGKSGGKGTLAGIRLSGCPCGKNRGRVSQEDGRKGQQRLCHRQQPECQVEGLGFLAGDDGGPLGKEAVAFDNSFTSDSIRKCFLSTSRVCRARLQARGGAQWAREAEPPSAQSVASTEASGQTQGKRRKRESDAVGWGESSG